MEGVKEARIATDVLYKLGEKDLATEIAGEINGMLKEKMIDSVSQKEKQTVGSSG